MINDPGAYMAFLTIALILPIFALMIRRKSPGTMLRMALAWIAIFAVGALLVAALAPLLGYHLT